MKTCLFLLVLAVASCGDERPTTVTVTAACTVAAALANSIVLVSEAGFQPSCIKVAVGDEITFLGGDNMQHFIEPVAEGTQGLDGGIISTRGFYRHTFANEGSYSLRCRFHPAREATVFVVAP